MLQKGEKITLDETLTLLESLKRSRVDNAKLEKAHGGSVAAVGTSQGAKSRGGGKKTASAQKRGASKQGRVDKKPCHSCGSADHSSNFHERQEK